MNITGMLAIGNGEGCPFCDAIIYNDDIFSHLMRNHKKEVNGVLFGEENGKNQTTTQWRSERKIDSL